MPAISSLHKFTADLSEKIQILHLAGASVKSACRDQKNDTVHAVQDSKKQQLKWKEKMGAGTEFRLYSIKKKKKSGKQGPVITTPA